MRASVLSSLLVLAWVPGACSGDGPGDAPVETDGALAGEVPEGDELLRTARQTMHDGKLDPEVVEKLKASDAPAHARARRILEVMDRTEPEEVETSVTDDEPVEGAGGSVPKLTAPTREGDAPTREGGAPAAPAPVPAVGDGPAGGSAPAPAADAPARARALVTGLRLRESRGGDVTLTIKANSGLLVGIANQPQSGIVRLVIDSAGALPKVLSSRDAVSGVSITSVSKGTDSVFVTLRLEEGWRLGKMRRVSGGASVTILAP